jgi:hypothetical protein
MPCVMKPCRYVKDVGPDDDLTHRLPADDDSSLSGGVMNALEVRPVTSTSLLVLTKSLHLSILPADSPNFIRTAMPHVCNRTLAKDCLLSRR